MQLRDHPAMSFAGVKNWPPTWVHSRSHPVKKANGEIGTLTRVHFYEELRRRLFLIVDVEGERYMGALAFNDPAFCNVLHSIFQSHIGWSIKDIGDLDSWYLL